MRKILTNIICIAICFSCILCLSSCRKDKTENTPAPSAKEEIWDDKLLESDPKGVAYYEYFKTVGELLDAIKRNPDLYNNKEIKVIGTIYRDDNNMLLIDYSAVSGNMPTGTSLMDEYLFEQSLNTYNKIEILITSDAQYAVAENGDYVKIYGTIRLEREHIYIDNCRCDLIATLNERKNNIDSQN